MTVDESMLAFGRTAAALQDQVRPGRRAQMRAGVLMRASRHQRRDRGASRTIGLIGGGAAVAAAAILLVVTRPPSSIEDTSGALVSTSAAPSRFVAPAEEPMVVPLADGSSLQLQPGAQAHADSPAAERRHVVLDEGSARAEVNASRDGQRVAIEAGPYRVDTEAASVDLRWRPVAHRLVVTVVAGAAYVTGPGLSSPVEVVSGERIELKPSAAHSTVVDHDGAVPRGTSPTTEPDEGTNESSPKSRRPRGSYRAAGSSPMHNWRELAREGRYRAAITAARAEGFDGLCRTLPADALLKLADAARYARQPVPARRALMAVRRRFSGKDAAALAAFDLGRLDANDCLRAQRWFRTYLRERPGGDLAEVATARVQECDRRSRRE